MENRLFKFMRAKFNKAVKAGKVRNAVAEYITYGEWRIELNLSLESWSLITPTKSITNSLELIDLVLEAIETGDNSKLDRINKAVSVKRAEVTGTDGKRMVITGAYYRGDGNIGIHINIYSSENPDKYRNVLTQATLHNYLELMERAGVI